jgi:di/tricarboxylate transporter
VADTTLNNVVTVRDSLWADVWRVTRPIVIDVIVFLVILLALLFGFFGLRALRIAGYDTQRVATLETMHYWFYTAVFGLFGTDLIFKIGMGLFFRKGSR